MIPAENKLKCRGTHIVDLDGDWTQHTEALPENSIPLGTVTLREAVGALFKVGDGEVGDFLMITADFAHKRNF
jgi:hypothetical protein